MHAVVGGSERDCAGSGALLLVDLGGALHEAHPVGRACVPGDLDAYCLPRSGDASDDRHSRHGGLRLVPRRPRADVRLVRVEGDTVDARDDAGTVAGVVAGRARLQAEVAPTGIGHERVGGIEIAPCVNEAERRELGVGLRISR